MGNLNSARRKLNEKSVWIAQEVERKRIEIAKEFVKERAKTDIEFAKDILKYVGEVLPEDIKKIAQEAIQKDDIEKNQEAIKDSVAFKREQLDAAGLSPVVLDKTNAIPDGCKPFISDGGCSTVDVPKEDLLKALEIASERQTKRLEEAGLLPEKECCGGECGCHNKHPNEEPSSSMEDMNLGDGFVLVQSDGGGPILVHETEHPNYLKDGGS